LCRKLFHVNLLNRNRVPIAQPRDVIALLPRGGADTKELRGRIPILLLFELEM
jgi:hypothetical protein